MNCKARIYMKKICKYPEYKIQDHYAAWRRKQISQRLKQALSSKEKVCMEDEIHLFFPGKNEHTSHLTGQFNII